jgi:hypothetical protein
MEHTYKQRGALVDAILRETADLSRDAAALEFRA